MGLAAALPETLFISDLHLSRERPATVALFLRFLSDRGRRAERLYILGDLFDAWIGDDDQGDPIPEVIGNLRRLVDSGVAISLMHGNRDFLIGEDFANATGCKLLPDPATIDLYGMPALLMHGDLLCTDDLAYQEFRKQIRSTPFKKDFLSRPLAERAAIAADYRRRSGEAL